MFGILNSEIHYGFKVVTVRKGDGNLEYVAMSTTKVDGLGLPVVLTEGNNKEQIISQAKGLTQDELQLDRCNSEAIR